ncbi:LacI family DNA-binding transcriptional regulator [Paenibacillus humicola]|uniref:LacI family DNA-binding transcriptional regulator n=1 Tax=Paenibacillus humicola TaxID=3110540 RepID=UPI00237A4083|nr:LacI family DNA-binding transcriptional regulator [Paenibacillus humicola]
MSKKVTTHDISSRLGISRNTVSKALNNHPSVSEETRRKVVEQAVAMGYKKSIPAADKPAAAVRGTRSIAFLTKMSVNAGYWMNLMRGVEESLRGNGCEMKISFINNEDIRSLVLPPMIGGPIDGFIVAGNLDKTYAEKLTALPIPKVFIDMHAAFPLTELQTDLVLMESEESVYRIVCHLIDSGHRDIAFMGDITSRSMFERWKGFSRAMYERQVPLVPAYCITGHHASKYQSFEGVAEALGALERFPTALVCANDITAIHAIRFAKENRLNVPGDLAVSGFDRIKETELLDVSLTTVSNDEFQLGLRAAEQLMYRIRRPDKPFEVIRLSTKIVLGESTRVRRDS